jgi:hypothetical protein
MMGSLCCVSQVLLSDVEETHHRQHQHAVRVRKKEHDSVGRDDDVDSDDDDVDSEDDDVDSEDSDG